MSLKDTAKLLTQLVASLAAGILLVALLSGAFDDAVKYEMDRGELAAAARMEEAR